MYCAVFWRINENQLCFLLSFKSNFYISISIVTFYLLEHIALHSTILIFFWFTWSSISRIFFPIGDAGNNCWTFREGRFTVEHSISLWMETCVFVLNVQIWWQLTSFQLIQWQISIDWSLVEIDDVIWEMKKLKIELLDFFLFFEKKNQCFRNCFSIALV